VSSPSGAAPRSPPWPTLDAETGRVIAGAAVGLVIGKPLGVLVACALALRLGVATRPAGLGARELVVLGFVAGIGFTMAMFIAQLAFTDPRLLAAAKLGALAASGVAAVLGLALGLALLREGSAPGAASTADEAER
jgi:NhaA family Na+:H+ antiporter